MSPTEFPELEGIYCIRNFVSNRLYIGESSNIRLRISNHYTNLSKLSHKKEAMNEDCEKYGIESFEFGILEYFDPWFRRRKAWREEIEREWMARLKPEYNSLRFVKDGFLAQNYIWRHFNPDNPSKGRYSPEFARCALLCNNQKKPWWAPKEFHSYPTLKLTSPLL